MDIAQYPVVPPKIVAIATEPGLKPTYKFTDPDFGIQPLFGEDFTFEVNGIPPNGEDVGATEAELKPQIDELLYYFAAEDQSGMARRLFRQFLTKQSQVTLWTDSGLNKAAAASDNFQAFCLKAMGVPWPLGIPPPPGKTRIHQALQAANWDVSKLVAPTDLGAPAFSQGDEWTMGWSGVHATGDWANGLALMIDAVQYVYVIATHYYYDKDAGYYVIRLKFIGYDVFGLDDEDLAKKGSSHWKYGSKGKGITAWWQLQHQHAYAPLVTRFVVEKDFAASITM